MPDDKPYRVFFPDPIVLHGTNVEQIRKRALEYLERTAEIRVEPMFAPKASESR